MAYNRWMYSDELYHHGVKGQKWGERNGPPYPLDSSKSDGHRLLSSGSPQGKKKLKKTKTVFVSGSSKTQDPNSEYYRGELPKDIRLALREHIRNGNKIIVGDAPGIDRQVQDYLKKQKYDNVEIYGPGKEVRYSANPKWKTNPIDDPDHEPGSKEWLAKKDIAMTEAADEGLAIILDDGAKATRNNVRRLLESQKAAKVYSLNKDGTNMWADEKELMSDKVVPKTTITSKSVSKANKIYDSLSDQEKYFLMAEKNAPRYVNPEEYGKKGTNVYSRIEQYKDTPVSVIDIWKNNRNGADVSIAVRNDEKFRHKGYASRALENGLKYFYEHPDIEYLVWGVNAANRPSIELAKKWGFEFYDDLGDGWQTYIIDKEAKHSMAYNRWMYSDELYHHGVKGQKWGERNGPPYPLDRSISDGTKLLPKATGSPQTKKKYKTSEKTAYQRKKRQEKIESTPDYKEKHSLVAEVKRSIRSYQKDRKAKREALEEKNLKDKAAWDKAAERLNNSDIPWEERKKILQEIAANDYDGLESGRYPASHPLWGYRPDRGLDAEKLNKFIDDYESKQKAARDAAKEHGTAEEVMKFRDTFSKEEWDSIASRLESEARVRKFLDKPLQSFDNGGNKQNQNSGNSSNQSKTVNAPENSKLKNIYEKGTAREVYQNRNKFTVEQLEAIEKRLSAEEEIGKRASNQVFLTPERIKKLEQVRDAVKIMGDIALTANKVNKAFNSGNTSTSGASDKKAKSDDTSTSGISGKKAKSDDTSASGASKKKVRTEMSGVDKDATYSVKFTGSDKIHKVVGSKLKDFVNKEGREVESAYVADGNEKSKSQSQSNTKSASSSTGKRPSYNMDNVLKVLKTVEQVSIDEERIRKYKSQRRDSEPQTTKSSQSSDVSRINEWIDRLSKVELISVDEERAGQIHPLENVGRIFTDEERKKR